MSLGNSDIEQSLDTLPDQVASALERWRISTLDREKCEALLYAQFKGEGKDRTATEIRSLIHADERRYNAVLDEIKMEASYNRLYETLMACKKKADLRTAY